MIGYWPKMFIGGYHKLMPLIRHDVIGGASWPAGGSSGGLRGGNLAIAEGRRSAALPGRAGDPSYGDYPLPRRDAAMDAPLRSFRSWFLRIECARCGGSGTPPRRT